MKSNFYHTIALAVIFSIFLSCSKDDNCTPKVFKENIVGSWNISFSVFGFSNSGTGTFNTDGSFTTNPNDLLIGSDNDKKTYTINDSLITFKSLSNGVSISIDGNMTSNSCNKIIIADHSLGGTLTFTK